MQKSEDYLRKRCLGDESSASKFFGDLEEEYSDNISDSEVPERAPTELNNETKTDPASVNSPDADEDSGDDDGGDLHSLIPLAQLKERRRIQNIKLLQCIKEGKVETHLLGVYRETIHSDRHIQFKNGSDAEKSELKHVPWFGPIDDEDQQEELYDYCSQLFKSSNFKPDGSFDTVAYLFEVWVPEVS